MSDDLIRRSDAIRIVCDCECCEDVEPCEEGRGCLTVKKLRALTSADRPKGKWELVPCTDLSEFFESVKNGSRYRCSNCKDERMRNKLGMNFCPNCGADMRGGNDDNQ